MAEVNLDADRSKPFVARRTFDYTPDLPLDRGQIFKLRGARNDSTLIRLGYVESLPARHDTFECPRCGAKFVDYGVQVGHMQFRHETKDDHAKAEKLEQIQSKEQLISPLQEDKTTAHRDPAEAARKARRFS